MSDCIKCGNYGLPGGCPNCGKDSTKKLELRTMTNVNKFIKKCEYSLIPEEYIGIEWKAEHLMSDHDSLIDDPSFTRFLNQCKKLHDSFVNNSIINKSVYIFSPPLFGKEILAFSCMQHAMANGLTVAPYLDTIDVKRLLVLGAERPEYKIYGRIDYDRYLTSDVVFVSVTHTSYLNEAYQTLLELISKRSRLGKTTHIISECSLEDLTKQSPKHLKTRWENVSSLGINQLKYPVVIGYVPRSMNSLGI